jgi:hypothetical protein
MNLHAKWHANLHATVACSMPVECCMPSWHATFGMQVGGSSEPACQMACCMPRWQAGCMPLACSMPNGMQVRNLHSTWHAGSSEPACQIASCMPPWHAGSEPVACCMPPWHAGCIPLACSMPRGMQVRNLHAIGMLHAIWHAGSEYAACQMACCMQRWHAACHDGMQVGMPNGMQVHIWPAK